MRIFNKREPLILFLGDLVAFALALWFTLFLRYGSSLDAVRLSDHFQAFSIIFLIWTLAFYIAGLYGKQTLVFKNRLPSRILKAQIVNSFLAIAFFYLVPSFGITPKTNLFIQLSLSFFLVLIWRLYGGGFRESKEKQSAILIGEGEEMKELADEINHNNRYAVGFDSVLDLSQISGAEAVSNIDRQLKDGRISLVVADLSHEKIQPILPEFYKLLFSRVKFLDAGKLYEEIFDRVPLSLIRYGWLLQNVSNSPKKTYDSLKRLMDLILGVIGGLVSLVFYPFVYLAIKLDDGGPVFISQERIGQNNKIFKILKFRTMTKDDAGYAVAKQTNRTTRVGGFLRRTRIDELPQLWNVLRGDLSLIGPRPELPILASAYDKDISYYRARHLIKPGLSGWAQLNQQNPPKRDLNFNDTKVKLSYDLFYLKNRSLFLDIKIALRTIADLLSRSGL
ncbi:MAG: exopolysaccharide biosynthesis polyprenyl glycosylphosphotransferase [Candidatus Paceibacterota bacterium]